jgi:hypothetical protein
MDIKEIDRAVLKATIREILIEDSDVFRAVIREVLAETEIPSIQAKTERQQKIERLIKSDFDKYDEVFKALA